MITPNRPEHEDYEFPIAGSPRLVGRRHFVEYAYPQNGNVHNPTPRYDWLLLADGKMVDRFDRKKDLVREATKNGAAYLSLDDVEIEN